MAYNISHKFYFLLVLLGVLVTGMLRAQCSGCTQSFNSSGASISVNAGQTVCINAGAVMTGTITLNGGTLCNAGTINALRISTGTIRNYGSIRDQESTVSLGGRVYVYLFSGSSMTFNPVTFSMGSADSVFFNVSSGGNLKFNGAVNLSSKKLSMDNSGTITISGKLTLSAAGLFLFNRSSGSFQMGDALNLTGSGSRKITNAGTMALSGGFSSSGSGSNTSTVTIINTGNLSGTSINNSMTQCVFQVTHAADGTSFALSGDLSLGSTGSLVNGGYMTVGHNFVTDAGSNASNSGTLNATTLLNIAGTFANSGYVTGGGMTIASSGELSNSSMINLGGNFSNSGVVTMAQAADFNLTNYYNYGTINGPASAPSATSYGSILISGTSQNDGYLNNKLTVYDNSLNGTSTNIGYGFDVVNNPTNISSSINFISVSVGVSNPPQINCSGLQNYYFVNAGKEQFSQCPGSSIYLYSQLLYSPSGSTNTPPSPGVVSSTSTWQPGNLVGNSYVTPTVTTTYTVTHTLPNGCTFTQTITVPITPIVYPTISYSVVPYFPGANITFPVTQTGPSGGTYSATPSLSINPTTGLITPTASPFGTYTVTYYIANLEGCGPYAAKYVVTLTNLTCNITTEMPLVKLCEGDKIVVQGFGGVDGYTFTPGTGLSCTACPQTTITAGAATVVYTMTSTRSGLQCGSYTFTVQIKDDCDKEEIIGCCFSNYGAAVMLNSSNTYLNVYCNLVNELVSTGSTLKKGEFKNNDGSVRVLLYWIHNGKNTLYITKQGITSLFGYDQKMKGNSNTYFHKLWLNGSGTKSIWINEYATSDLDFTSNVLAVQNFTFYMKDTSALIALTSGFASTGTNGYFSRALRRGNAVPANSTKYLYPLGAPGTSVTVFRYRPLEVLNATTTQTDEISANFMNKPPSLQTDPVFVHVNPMITNVVTDQSPSVLQINNAFYHKIQATSTTVTQPSTLTVRSYYTTNDGQYQSIAEWEKDPAQPKDWWGTTPGASGSTTLSNGLGTSGMLYAQTSGTLNFKGKPFTLSRGGFYVNTSSFGNNGNGNGGGGGNGTIITLTSTPGGTNSPTPSGGGLNNPFGTGSNSGNNGNGNPTVFSPNPVAGEYVMTVTPPNDCAVPGKIKFVIDQNGNINPTSVEYGLANTTGYLGQLSEAVYTIDNVNSGITFSATPGSLLRECVNTITVTTTLGADYVMTPGENIIVKLPAPIIGSITYGQFKIYSTAVPPVYTSATLAAGINTVIPSPTLSAGVYRFELSVSANTTPAISETIKGQLIVK